MRRWVALALVAGCLRGVPDHLPEHVPQPPPPVPAAPVEGPVVGPKQPGPLAVATVSINDQSFAAVRDRLQAALIRDRTRPMAPDQVAEDAAVLERVVDTYAPALGDLIRKKAKEPVPRPMANSLQAQTESALRDAAIILEPGNAPYPAWSWPAPPPATGATHEWFEPTPGVVELAVRDLTSPWQLDLSRLQQARALVIDLRRARGTDPRALIPLLEALTGRAPLAPLRAIERPVESDEPAAAYAARYQVDTRDPAIWAQLVGSMPAAKNHRALPITIAVGRGCEAACELATRVLETYAGATVYGPVGDGARLAHDEPARVVLPHSKVQVLFFTTRYRLATEIEEKTGPTDQWHRRHTDDSADLDAFAARDAEARLHGGWPRCDAQPWVATPEQLSPALRAKIDRPDQWTKCRGKVEVVVTARVPAAVLEPHVASCGVPDLRALRGSDTQFQIIRSSGIPFGTIAQLASSPLVEHVAVVCHVFDTLVLE